MRLLWIVTCLSLILPIHAEGARLAFKVPPGITEVRLLSPGTGAVLDHMKARLRGQLKAVDEKYQVARLEAETKEASTRVSRSDKAYTQEIETIRKQYGSRIAITIHSAAAQITPESAMGDITFTYTARNNTDRIVSDIVYRPLFNKAPLPMTSSLVLEFIHPTSLVYGLAPGESMANTAKDPEHFSFFLGEISSKNVHEIQSSLPGGFTIEVLDINFVAQKGYKGQSKVMGVKEAFAGRLAPYQAASRQARDLYLSKTSELTSARKLFESETRVIRNVFAGKIRDLEESSVRYKAPVDPGKNKGTFVSIKPGAYYLYAVHASGGAVFVPTTIRDKTNRIRIETLGKDPFTP